MDSTNINGKQIIDTIQNGTNPNRKNIGIFDIGHTNNKHNDPTTGKNNANIETTHSVINKIA